MIEGRLNFLIIWISLVHKQFCCPFLIQLIKFNGQGRKPIEFKNWSSQLLVQSPALLVSSSSLLVSSFSDLLLFSSPLFASPSLLILVFNLFLCLNFDFWPLLEYNIFKSLIHRHRLNPCFHIFNFPTDLFCKFFRFGSYVSNNYYIQACSLVTIFILIWKFVRFLSEIYIYAGI